MKILWNDPVDFFAAGISKSDNNLDEITKAVELVENQVGTQAGNIKTSLAGLYIQGNEIMYSPPPWEEDFHLGTIED